MRNIVSRSVRKEQGQALILVLIFLLVGSLLVTSLLSYMSTGLKTGLVYKEKTDELYAADAGIEDSLWQIQYDNLNTLFSTYDDYEYGESWTYSLPEQVNNKSVNVTIENVWIPSNMAAPNKIPARNIIHNGKLIVTGSISAASTYQIKIYYYKDDADGTLMTKTLGIWLPAGFDYVVGSSNLEEDINDDYYTVPVVSPHAGGQSIIWDLGSYPFAGSGSPVIDPLPGVNPLDSPMSCTITFQFTSAQANRNPEAVSWITTGGVSDIPYSWDADTSVYRITSVANGTEVEAYTAKSEIRELGTTIAGDYRAVGNSLMIDNYYSNPPIRDTLLSESSATVDDIPADADVAAAYLYWSAWLDGSNSIWEEDCRDFSDWYNPANDWRISSRRFQGHHNGNSPDWQRYLALKNSLDLSPYQNEIIEISWDQSTYGYLEPTDGLDFAFSADGGITWSTNIIAFRGNNPQSNFSYEIPKMYLTDSFKVRFYLVDCSNEYIYIDNIQLASTTIADTSAIFKIDGQQVYFDGSGVPQQGAQEINASKWSVLENKVGTYSYACYLDVTDLITEFSSPAPEGNHTGNAVYTVGDVDADTGDEWSYAGWSLIIIYSSPNTAGHQLYLYDSFIYSGMNQNVDFDGDGSPGGNISGFLVPQQVVSEVDAARLTVFVGEGDDYYNGDYLRFNGSALSDGRTTTDVWNSWSLSMSVDGVDIDTFHVTWNSGLLVPGDTYAQIDLPTQTDSWNLIYIIISFRSEITAGGAISYMIRG